MSRLVLLFCWTLVLAADTKALPGQDALRQRLSQEIERLRANARAISQAGASYYHGTQEESSQHRARFEEAVASAEVQMQKVEAALTDLIKSGAELTAEEFELAVQIHGWMIRQGYFHRGYEFGKSLMPNPDKPVLIVEANQAMAALATCRFDEAFRFIERHPQLLKDLPQFAQDLFPRMSELRSKFEREEMLRAAEAEADDLPRVVLKTSKGQIVVELYENEAPDTVGNFIYLVESGFYTDIIFHRVIADNIAQTGGYGTDQRERAPDYVIFDECTSTDARHHFYGTLSMALTNLANSGNSQFFITYIPYPHLDGKHTVFGRVISGFDALESLNRTHEVDDRGEEKPIAGVVPDRIISAEVLRKRDRDYQPRRVRVN